VSVSPSDRLLWFSVLGGAVAWAVQFVANLAFTLAQCQQPARWMLSVHSWEIGISVVALLVGLASGASALRLFRRTYRIDHVMAQELHGDGHQPPLGRVHFLSIIGLTLNVISLTIIVMTAIGAPLLPVCQQS
jgi:hypothetical protein